MAVLARRTRRRATRHETDWAARCRFGPGEWVDGRVVNVSSTGAAVQFDRSVPTTGPVTVEMAPTSRSRLRVGGEIRHVRTGADGLLVLGVEFVALTPDETAKLARMVEKHAT